MKYITIKGARVHNLKNIDVSIPKNKLIVATGVSGSGKSSLMFDLVFEEGRKQYLQSLGILVGLDNEDKFDSISGIGPTVAVQQNNVRQSNPLSTVGSRTKILNLLALLFSSESVGLGEHLPPNYFLYNTADGMCMECSGRGALYKINFNDLIPDSSMTLEQVFENAGATPGYLRLLQKKYQGHLKQRFFDLPEDMKEEAIYGHYTDGNSGKRSYCLTRIFQGRLRRGEDLGGIYAKTICPVCCGFRVGDEAQRTVIDGKHIGELGNMTVSELHMFLEKLYQKSQTSFAKNLLQEILRKTNNLQKSHLGHLSLYREIPTLSGGEIQRLFLNAHLDSNMDSLIYVLDEPTAGLHESEKRELLESIRELQALGNTVIVVEHDKNTIQAAEHIIDIGPKASVEGGQIIYQGDLAGLLDCEKSLTAQYLSGKKTMPSRMVHSIPDTVSYLTMRHAKTNNLKDITVSFPLGAMVGIAGVSGSGKSSLVSDTLLSLLKSSFHDNTSETEELDFDSDDEPITALTVADKLEGIEYLSGYAEISQAPIGRNKNSTPVSYVGIWDKIRTLYARQPTAIKENLSAGHFSFNSKGACGTCGGSGYETTWLGGDLKIDRICGECHGKRFNDEALSVKYKGKSICDVLEMSVSDAVCFFEDNNGIASALQIMERIGMGYIKLGQPTPTLSGGEAQRIKLSKELGKKRKGNILYVLDEPTTGLSLYDTARLIELLDELVASGNSVIVVEHDPAVLTTCDWIIELGPGGGVNGGSIIAEGPPAAIKENPNSVTGRYL